jgi:tRNA pseudouridine55 synthase
VRALCSDVGEALGCGACLARLRRTRSGELDVADAVCMDRVREMNRRELLAHVLPMNKFRMPPR